jgi:adenosylcobyric acid synthase
VNVAPFKGQNMALNSFITKEGGEIGRAQAYQAEAARVEPSVDMNPVLLKATGEAGCQVILNGKVHSNMAAREYYGFKKEAWAAVVSAYERLFSRHDLVIIEGAGSPAEINLSNDEVVNMSVARLAKAPVILVGDIDKGGVFASLFGTIALLDGDADYIKAFIINKFRGDLDILKPGLDMIRDRTDRPVLGVLPYLGDMGLHEEDGIPVERFKRHGQFNSIRIAVLALRYISNFTDFDPFLYEPDVELTYTLRESDIENADLVVIPGSKNTVQDLLFLRETGIEASLKRAAAKGIPVVGICGGYQMLGRGISDPFGVESKEKEVEGIGLLDVETVLEQTKVTAQIEAEIVRSSKFQVSSNDEQNKHLKGYEIHMGKTTGDVGLFKLSRVSSHLELETGNLELILDGSRRENVWGTYIHGIFDNNAFRREVINELRTARGLTVIEEPTDFSLEREKALDRWADVLKNNIDMKYVDELVGI